MTAEEAKRHRFVNEILPGFDGNAGEFPDLAKIPTIGKLLATDQRTLENCMQLINAARDNDRLDATIWRELKLCLDNNMDPDFIPKMIEYMQSTLGSRKAKAAEPKL